MLDAVGDHRTPAREGTAVAADPPTDEEGGVGDPVGTIGETASSFRGDARETEAITLQGAA